MRVKLSSFDSETLCLLDRAYSEALDELKRSLGWASGSDKEALQKMLTDRIIGLAATGERDVEALRNYAIKGVDPRVKPGNAAL